STSQDINNAFDVAGDIADEKRMSLTQTRIMEALGTTNISEFFAQKIFDEKHSFLSPNVSLKMILFTVVAILDKSTQYGIWELPQLILNLLCAICVVVCGIFALCEYFICTLEYCLVTGVGVLMLPFMLWDGTKFLSEKFMSALVGFFLKLLFCTICVLLTLYGFLGMAITPYTGAIEEIVSKVFLCVFYFLLCKQGPNLATALLTGTPTLNMGAAVGAAAGAGAAVGAIFGKGAGLAAKGTFGAAGAITQAASAGGAAGLLGGSGKDKFGAVMSSFGNSAMEGLKSSGGSLTKSLLSSKGGAAGGGGAGGFNPHSQLEKFKQKNSDGSRQSLTEHLTGRQEAGTNAGIDYMARKEAKQAGKKS
ncbi:MAG: type IV secretion system protein, partial [Spirochaetaceae bacterium]|nr:type IV secretion system protein [Spirochaetaceae bacterium]